MINFYIDNNGIFSQGRQELEEYKKNIMAQYFLNFVNDGIIFYIEFVVAETNLFSNAAANTIGLCTYYMSKYNLYYRFQLKEQILSFEIYN